MENFPENDLKIFENFQKEGVRTSSVKKPKMPQTFSPRQKIVSPWKFMWLIYPLPTCFLTTFLVGKSTLFLMSISKIFFTQVPTTKTREKIDKFFFAYLLPKTLGFLLMYFSNRIRTCSTLNKHETCFIFFSMSNLYIVIQIPKWYTFYISETD